MASESGVGAGTPRHALATRLVFFIVGVGAAGWAPLIPFAKARVGADNGVLGMVLLASGLGAMVTMPLSGLAAARFGCRPVIATMTLVFCACLPLLAFVSSLPVLVGVLFLFGACMAALDVTINVQAIAVERESGRPMMSGFHGFYSLGGIAGAAGVTALLALRLGPLGAAVIVAGGILAALAASLPGLLQRPTGRGAPVIAFPHGVVWFIGALCFILYLAEGSVLDWSAVFLSSDRAMPREYAGLGYAAFAAAMTLGRLTGDPLVHRLGGRTVILTGGLCAAAGFALAALGGSWPAAMAGYALVGIGCANVVPVLFTAIGRQTAMPEAVAVTAVSIIGYAGILIGPGAIGLVAREFGLGAAFLILAAMLAGVAASGRMLRV
jgi:predicted MFS family arabinose efflux permease